MEAHTLLMELRPDIAELIVRHIDSIEVLELLLLLRRSPETFWTSSAAASALATDERNAAQILNALARDRLLVRAASTPGAYRYAPTDDSARSAVDGLANAYESNRIDVVNAIYTRPMIRLRAFSDAFRLKDE